jgi:hypothetical protein
MNNKRGAHGNQDSDQATSWITNVCDSIPGRRKRFFDVQSVHKISGTHRVNFPAGIDGKRVGREAGHPSPSVAEDKTGQSYSSRPSCALLFGAVTNLHLT